MNNCDLSPELKEKIIWFRRRLRPWFRKNQRNFPWRELSRTPYEVLIAEVMLRQTKAETVARFYPLFLKKYPDFRRLSTARIKTLENLIKPLGLWRQRAPIFRTIVREINKYKGQLPTTREELESLSHIGQYIASVILTTFHGEAEPFIDINMARVVDRFFGPRKLADIRYDPYLATVSRELVKNRHESLHLNWAILDFAAIVCKAKNPLCDICPVNKRCLYYQGQTSKI